MDGWFFTSLLPAGANIAQIVTGIVAAIIGGRYLWRARQRRLKLEDYLRLVKVNDERFGDAGMRTVMHLMAHTAMTEAEVLEAAFASNTVKRWINKDSETGLATGLFFQYDPRGGAN